MYINYYCGVFKKVVKNPILKCNQIKLKIWPAIWVWIAETFKLRYEAKLYRTITGEIWFGILKYGEMDCQWPV